MKHLACQLLFILLVFTGINVFAQEAYTISGTVTDGNQQPIKGATIFINGSQQITATDATGRFIFSGMVAGNYVLSTKMLGYAASSREVIISDKSVTVTFALEVKLIQLNEVKISADNNREKHYKIFKEQFLGTSAAAKKCVILNPEIIHFSSKKINYNDIFLSADADDFLIIENKQLGYRIKYLLKKFEYNSLKNNTFYDGDNNFESLDGNSEQKKIWEQNRLMAYKGSLMHFLRSVFANNVTDEGFIANQMYTSNTLFDTRIYMNPLPAKFDTLVTTIDSSFVSFKFTALNISYNPKKAARLKKSEIKKQQKPEEASSTAVGKPNNLDYSSVVNQTGKTSQLLLYLKIAIIDARGSVSTGLRTFLIRGNWAKKRIGDQLPFEYQPTD